MILVVHNRLLPGTCGSLGFFFSSKAAHFEFRTCDPKEFWSHWNFPSVTIDNAKPSTTKSQVKSQPKHHSRSLTIFQQYLRNGQDLVSLFPPLDYRISLCLEGYYGKETIFWWGYVEEEEEEEEFGEQNACQEEAISQINMDGRWRQSIMEKSYQVV